MLIKTPTGKVQPYIVHPLDVASTLMKNNAPERVVIAGLLHDVVEDEDYTLSDIRDKFGEEVATLVDGASEPEELINAHGGKSKTWPERKAHTIDFIKTADRDMKLLSCADKLANIRAIIRDYDMLGDGVWDIFNASKDSVAWYYISMLDAFGNGDEGIRDMPAFKEFGKCVGEMFGDVKV
jgi:hypothetical protein